MTNSSEPKSSLAPRDTEQVLSDLMGSDIDLYAAASGAGPSLAVELWSPPGASKYLVGTAFPYARFETDAFLGFKPSSYCSEATALNMAAEAFTRAKTSSYQTLTSYRPALGLGVSASVASKEAHSGDHRVHISVVTDYGGRKAYSASHILKKGVGRNARTRDEVYINMLAFDMIAYALGTAPPPVDTETIDVLAELRNQILDRPFFASDGHRRQFGDHSKYAFFPGSFNPLHDGHRFIYNGMRYEVGMETLYTICVDSVHKPPLDGLDILDRAAVFRAEGLREEKHTIVLPPSRGSGEVTFDPPKPNLLFTAGDPLFVDKIQKYPCAKWALGADTLDNLLDPKWGPATADVLRLFDSLRAELYVFQAKNGDAVLRAEDVLLKYGVQASQRTAITALNYLPPAARSTELRAHRKTGS